MNFKKIFAAIMCVVCILNFAGCKSSPDSSTSSQAEILTGKTLKNYITLLYSSGDTFNPYTAETDINRQLCRLIYEPLIKLDNSFSPVYSIAESVECEGAVCTVKLKNTVFSDGSALSSKDVVYSYNLAKNSKTVYGAELYEVVSVSSPDSATVVFTLSKSDPYFINVLDFPILKAESDKITDSDGVLQPPVGSGRYKVSDDRQSLVSNGHYGKRNGSIRDIKLINAPDADSVSHYVEIGAADIYYNDLSDGKIIRMSGQKFDINLNSLIYIGINKNSGVLADETFRQALSSGIDRTKICNNAYYNNALPATGFFNPVWEEVKSVQNIQIEANSQITVENLEKIGYNVLDNEGKRKNKAGEKLRFTLLVNSENRLKAQAAALIANQLSQYGITVTIVEKHYAAYLEALKKGDFQLYLGEIKISDNMDISSLVLPEGSAAFGVEKEEESKTEENEEETEENTEENVSSFKPADIVNGFYSGQNTLADLASVLQTNMPFVPVCYRTGALFCNDSIENVENSSESDIYFSITEYNNYQ